MRNLLNGHLKIQGEIVRQSDIVLLPVNNDHEMTMYKGPVDALRQGD